ncbi:hypothetical protein ACOACO_17380 [Nocardioides sp. CPCC 205120]|uniref:hypothetical protein n=1 Tax=Nocardioides sp. CPCC 205120 TaxID=3406462 RepID=UPI003B503064
MQPWQVARLTRIDVVRLTWLLFALALVRGFDYVTGDDARLAQPPPEPLGTVLGYSPRSALVGVEAAFPLWIWGALILLAVSLLAVGLLGRWHRYVWLGHVVLSAAYTGLAIGLAYGYFERPWLDGIRSASGLVLPACLHTLLWWRMGPKPIDLEIEEGGARGAGTA